jgi:hypothetical protein
VECFSHGKIQRKVRHFDHSSLRDYASFAARFTKTQHTETIYELTYSIKLYMILCYEEYSPVKDRSDKSQ